ncbi:UDP-3-O-(3-hydroxymyristoyl)glucosamine N-acyltransferase [Taibaiella lutea]|uniref:UDP-3-O-(3-hydroxymyristoyl)glucosamine N-acyltransferase n=1 Tax=Taibaiella lutea TaxID=2608001 RepID=A0A5M6CEZ3_9BACT|nr:UDP-3-O-(3-hydroxymyristoyl)glucosamine N-acyltransferase [Taibaiella lutea]KAA5533768.1 UDP-3-O-(3-hydroxymyristoyl)glucosamine N-acyltransferase [Taibaiella lutea]
MNFTVEDIKPIVKECIVEGNETIIFNNVKPIDEANETSLAWISSQRADKEDLIKNTKARVIICDNDFVIYDDAEKKLKCFIRVKNPRLSFLRIVSALFEHKILPSIHATAVIHNEAVIGKNAYIGPNTVIGKSVIGENAVIFGNVFIYDDVIIGNQVVINAGVTIGSSGFGYSENEEGNLERFPHIGGVIIGDNVEIGANCSIDRGTLGNTILGNDVKLDNLVHVAHNVKIGNRCLLPAACMISGSVDIGDDVWIGPNSSISSNIKIENKGFITIGAVVTKNVAFNEKVTGNFAIPHEQFIKNLKRQD